MAKKIATTYEFKTPQQQSRMTFNELQKYVAEAQASMRAQAAARGGKCVGDDNKCPKGVDDSGFLCSTHRMQFSYWNSMSMNGERAHEFIVK